MNSRPGACRSGWLAVALAWLLGACSSPVDNPSAYDAELFLCEPDQADRWQSELQSCRSAYEQDGSCAGLMSFAGVLQDQRITVDARLDSVIFDDVEDADGSIFRHQIKLSGVSPYFRFRLRLWEVGGGIAIDEQRALEVLAGRSPDPEPEPLQDGFVRAALRLSASSQSEESSARAGTLSVSLQADAEQAATFHLEIAKDVIDGCFHAFATEHNLIAGAGP